MTLTERERRAIGEKTRLAIKTGRLVRQPCEVCGLEPEWRSSTGLDRNRYMTVQAHHDDYAKPFDVRWLCTMHHAEHHNDIRALRERGLLKGKR